MTLHPEFYKDNWTRWYAKPFDMHEAKASLKN
jgi:hypothetical protein